MHQEPGGQPGEQQNVPEPRGGSVQRPAVTHESHAVYYPGCQPLTVKVVAERGSGRLLGAQLSGQQGVAKRVDIFAAALHQGATVDEVEAFDLTYAPPFAPVWDPVLLAARKAAEAV